MVINKVINKVTNFRTLVVVNKIAMVVDKLIKVVSISITKGVLDIPDLVDNKVITYFSGSIYL